MHKYLKAVGFSKINETYRDERNILDVIRNYDEKNLVEDHRMVLLLNSPSAMDTTAELLFVVSTTMITGFTWNIIIPSSEEMGLRQMNR